MAVSATQISNLLAIARCGSFTQAAQFKGMSQPALSNSIALLEQRLGLKVLVRGRSGSSLTSFGEILVRRAEGLQLLLDDAEEEVRLCAKGLLGPLRIGATPSMLPTLLPATIASLTAAVGAVSVEVVEGLDESFSGMLANGQVDIVVGPVGDLFGQGPGVVEVTVWSEPIGIAMGQHHPLAGLDAISLSDLERSAWILPRPGSNFRQHVEAMFRTHAIPWPEDVVLTNAVSMMEGLLMTSDRVAVVTPIQLSKRPGVAYLKLVEGCSRSIGYKLRRNSELTPLGTLFVEHFKSTSAVLRG